jgi:hypothetical protein
VFCKILKLEEFIYESDDDWVFGNFLHYLAKEGFDSMINFALVKLKNDLSEEEFIKYILKKSVRIGNFFKIAINNKELNFKAIIDFFKENLTIESFKNLLKLDNLLILSISSKKFDLFAFLWETYSELFTNLEIVEILIQENFSQEIAQHVKFEKDFEINFDKLNFLVSEDDKFKAFKESLKKILMKK